ncbi:MAG: hypothetical protein IPN64_10495 [Propionivibrio sp.]|uniref:hypothetical protein n=1 Tax=Propionivibrio sp. TaxID=2212460 RepID=UPI0025FC320B|nr:hypothetical protein [Propionivibrio sp.]MBK8894449.1 hypothetical protein [Propionivibrio sp.]
MLIYLGCSALAVVLSTFALLIFGELPLLAGAHLVLAVAILPLIFGAIAHFVPVLTRSGQPHRVVLLLPLLLQASGLLVFLHFDGRLGPGALLAAVYISLPVCLVFIGWLMARARHALGKPHPGWRWYLAALVFLALGLALVPVMQFWPEARQELRGLHLHLNLLGFIGLTAIGTLQVLLPTVLGGPDPEAALRLRQDLPLAVAGVLLVGSGAVFGWPLALLGAGALIVVLGRLWLSWLHRYGLRAMVSDGASASLLAALCGFLLLLVFGIAHAIGVMDGHAAVAAFIAAFLLPLVTGALSQLMPVWRHPGRRTLARDRMRAVLVKGGAIRALLFVSGGGLLAFGQSSGYWLTATGLLIFLVVLVRAFCFPGPEQKQL